MEYTQIMYLLLSLILFENYFILKKYKSIFLNIVTFIYIVILPFYCFTSMPNVTLTENVVAIIPALLFVLIGLLTPYYMVKLSVKDIKKYPLYGVGWLLFAIFGIVLGKVMP